MNIPTLATNAGQTAVQNGKVTEPIAVTQRVVTNGVLKIIFWFAATADSTIAFEERSMQEHEHFESVWVSAGEARSILSWGDDRRVTTKVLEAVRLV